MLQQAIHTNTLGYLGWEVDNLLKWDVHIRKLSRTILMNLATVHRLLCFELYWNVTLQNYGSTLHRLLLLLSFIQTISLHKKKGTYIQHISYSNQSIHTFKQITNLMVVKSKWFPTPFYSPLILIWHFIIHSSPGIMLDSLYCVCILCLIILWGLSISSDIERSYSSLILLRLRPLGERQFSKASLKHIGGVYYFLASCSEWITIVFHSSKVWKSDW